MNNEEKILALLEKLTANVSDLKITQATLTEKVDGQQSQLTELVEMQEELRNAVNRVAIKQEHTVIPRLDTLYEGQLLMQETLARKESVEELKDAIVESETATNASLSEMWKRIAKLEKAK